MRRLIVLASALAMMGFIACAQGTSDGPSGTHADARMGTGTDNPDAPSSSQPDAFQEQPDAFVAPPADANDPTPDAAGSGSNFFCNSDSDCNVAAGECCLIISTPPGVCITNASPIPGICLP